MPVATVVVVPVDIDGTEEDVPRKMIIKFFRLGCSKAEGCSFHGKAKIYGLRINNAVVQYVPPLRNAACARRPIHARRLDEGAGGSDALQPVKQAFVCADILGKTPDVVYVSAVTEHSIIASFCQRRCGKIRSGRQVRAAAEHFIIAVVGQ